MTQLTLNKDQFVAQVLAAANQGATDLAATSAALAAAATSIADADALVTFGISAGDVTTVNAALAAAGVTITAAVAAINAQAAAQTDLAFLLSIPIR